MDTQVLLHALVDAEADFIVIGGWCAIFHGSSYNTRDLDIFFPRTGANIKRLVEALAPYHPRPRGLPPELPFVWEPATLRNGTIFTLTTDVGDIDLLAEVSGLGPYEEVAERGQWVEAFGCRVKNLDLKDLIAAKRAAGRKKDLEHLMELESLLEAQEDPPERE